MKKNQMLMLKTSVKNELGMHARPASQIAQMADSATSDVWLWVDSQKIDATSIIDILAMCAIQGTIVDVEVDNPDDIAVLDQIVQFFESGFGEI